MIYSVGVVWQENGKIRAATIYRGGDLNRAFHLAEFSGALIINSQTGEMLANLKTTRDIRYARD